MSAPVSASESSFISTSEGVQQPLSATMSASVSVSGSSSISTSEGVQQPPSTIMSAPVSASESSSISTFNQFDNKYDVVSYKRICAEFGVDPSSDFRFTRGANNGLGDVYIYVTNIGPTNSGADYPGYDLFSDEGGTASKGNVIYHIEPDDTAYAQADWFCPNGAEGLTQAGLSRINQSIEAFVYCVLGSQVNVRSSILGSGGRAKEAQSEFLVLVEDAIRQPDLAKSVQRYQLAIDEAEVRLNLAVCPGAWLMPARMLINTESTAGYNNQLKQAVQGMKLGINNGVNTSTKKAALQLMAGGKSKINPPNSHPF